MTTGWSLFPDLADLADRRIAYAEYDVDGALISLQLILNDDPNYLLAEE